MTTTRPEDSWNSGDPYERYVGPGASVLTGPRCDISSAFLAEIERKNP